MTPDPLTAADLAWWYPRLRAAGVLTPATVVLPDPPGGVPPAGVPADAAPGGAYLKFLAAAVAAGDRVGWPAVVRTGLAAAKHDWLSACLARGPGDLDERFRRTAAWCAARGIPVRTWAIRQYIPLAGFVAAFDGLRLSREFRVTLRDAAPLCVHPLWPEAAVRAVRPADPRWPDALERVADLRPESERRVLLTLAAQSARLLPGEWSIDWAASADGRWVALDAAPAALAWHPPDCPHHPAHPDRAAADPVPPDQWAIDPDSPDGLPLVWQLEQCLEDDFRPPDPAANPDPADPGGRP